MKSSGTEYGDLFESYSNMRDRSEITEEIAVVRPLVGETTLPGWYDEKSYNQGYLDALEWVMRHHSVRRSL
jgi:hypothetical protein